MSKQSAENYLDELLNAMTREEQHRELMSGQKVLAEEIQGTINQKKAPEKEPFVVNSYSIGGYRRLPRTEAEFLAEFEEELAGEDLEDYLSAYDMDAALMEEDTLGAKDLMAEAFGNLEAAEESFPTAEDVFPVMEESFPEEEEAFMAASESFPEEDAFATMEDAFPTIDDVFPAMDDAFPAMEEVPASKSAGREEISLEDLSIFGELDGFEELPLSEIPDVAPADAMDLSEMGDEDLINLLAGADDLSDIGDLLSGNSGAVAMESEDAFASFAAGEIAGHAEESHSEDVADAEVKKPGFLDKILSVFKKDKKEVSENPAAEVDVFASTDPNAEELSQENADILAMFGEVEKPQASAEDAGQKKKKEKKEKKKKEPKEKKVKAPKAPKAPKPKKEKPPKEKDNTPPLPKGPTALIILLAVSLGVLIFFAPDLIGYSSAKKNAENLLNMGQYKEAAEALHGIAIKEEDAMLYGKVTTLASVDSEIYVYELFREYGTEKEALDALICAAGRCVTNEDASLTFDCAGLLESLKAKVTAELKNQYGLSFEEAVEVYELSEKGRDDYTYALDKILAEMGK